MQPRLRPRRLRVVSGREPSRCSPLPRPVGAALRVLLAVRSPTTFGYVYDFYHEAIQTFYVRGRLPRSTECWECYQPPLFYLLLHYWMALFGESEIAMRALTLAFFLATAVQGNRENLWFSLLLNGLLVGIPPFGRRQLRPKLHR